MAIKKYSWIKNSDLRSFTSLEPSEIDGKEFDDNLGYF